jgi:catechol 2,3-dioxygenase-like lactoylglutathione lyase family enzyme
MAGRIRDKGLRHVSLCFADLAKAKVFYGDVLGLEELPLPDLGIPGAWLSVGGDLQLHLLENPERAAAGSDHRLSIADPHFALDQRRAVARRGAPRQGSRGPREQARHTVPTGVGQDPDGNMVDFIGPATASGDD